MPIANSSLPKIDNKDKRLDALLVKPVRMKITKLFNIYDMSIELSKKDKRIARELIEKGLQIEFHRGLQQFDAILQKWKNEQQDNRDTYHHLYRSVRDFDKHIARRYDNMKGSTYVRILGAQLADKLINENDLAEMNPDSRNAVISWARIILE